MGANDSQNELQEPGCQCEWAAASQPACPWLSQVKQFVVARHTNDAHRSDPYDTRHANFTIRQRTLDPSRRPAERKHYRSERASRQGKLDPSPLTCSLSFHRTRAQLHGKTPAQAKANGRSCCTEGTGN